MLLNVPYYVNHTSACDVSVCVNMFVCVHTYGIEFPFKLCIFVCMYVSMVEPTTK